MAKPTGAKQRCTYDPTILSEDEKRRFVASLGNGFGYSHRSQHLGELGLPTEVKRGLLEHQAYYYKDRTTEYLGDDEEGEFWLESDDDSPPGAFEQCPINFHLPAIRKYFEEQKAAYLAHVNSSSDDGWLDELQPEVKSNWEERIYSRVLYETYSKAWYEYHINQHIYFLDESAADLVRHANKGDAKLGVGVMLITDFSAKLGRLVEQYYWKFLLEKAAIRGLKLSEAARSGGLLRASRRKREHAEWQDAARLVRKERPTRSNMAVAAIVKKRLKIDRSVKHISRVLRRA